MVRPKTILWVDDEVEGLAAHRRFLEDQGFTVAAAAHGDDALALLRRQAYSIVLLDEQMPGRRGLELIGEIRALVAERARWEVRRGAANEPGLSEAPRSLQRSLRKDFAEYVARQYPRWLASPEGDRPPLSVDVGAEFLVPVLRSTGRVLFVVIDCLRLDQWEVLRDLVTPLVDVEEAHYYSILPTATPVARNPTLSGPFPMAIAARHPGWWGQPSDE